MKLRALSLGIFASFAISTLSFVSFLLVRANPVKGNVARPRVIDATTADFKKATGHPMAGPPQRELPLIQLEVVDGGIYAVGRQTRHE